MLGLLLAASLVLPALPAAPLAASDVRLLKERPSEGPGGRFLVLPACLGSGRRVVGRVTFDRKKASAGGWVYAVARATPEDSAAIRLSAAVLSSGGLLGHAAVEARRHGIPALLVEAGAWVLTPQPCLRLGRTEFADAAPIRGFAVQLAKASVPAELPEGGVVLLDPAAGSMTLLDPGVGQVYLDAGGALAAYDGLKDGQALAQWVDSAGPELTPELRLELAGYLLAELAERAGGAAGVSDFAKVRAALGRLLGPASAKALGERERRAFRRELGRAAAFLDEASAELPSASPAWAQRLCRQAESRRERLGLLGAELRLADHRSLAPRFDALERLCAKARAGSPGAAGGASSDGELPAALLKSAGASTPGTALLPASLYRAFMAASGLEGRVETIAGDSSLLIGQRSARIRSLILSEPMPGSVRRSLEAGLPSGGAWAVLSPGQGPRILRPGDDSALRERWASLWSPGSLARRRREGGGVADAEAAVELVRLPSCERSALALSRDPASGLRRVWVSAAYGELEGVLSGRSGPDQYVLGPDGREVLPAVVGDKPRRLDRDARGAVSEAPVPAQASSRRALSPSELERLAAVARVLDGHRGRGVEVAACFSGADLIVLGASPIDRLPAGD